MAWRLFLVCILKLIDLHGEELFGTEANSKLRRVEERKVPGSIELA